jgi:hypothetical protein
MQKSSYIRGKSNKMKGHTLKVYCLVEVKDKGKVIYSKKFESHSFVGQWLQLLYGMFGQNSLSFLNNNFPAESINVNALQMNAGSGNQNFGIQVGSGTTKSINDTGLATLIPNGNSAGQLAYGAMSFISPTINASTNQGNTSISRSFTNNSGGSVTVSEVGVVLRTYASDRNSYFVFIIHDILSSPITLANGQVLTVTYIFSIQT